MVNDREGKGNIKLGYKEFINPSYLLCHDREGKVNGDECEAWMLGADRGFLDLPFRSRS